MPKPFFDDSDDDVTVFEPNPWGARQRVLPRKTFKAAVSRIVTLVPSLVRQLPPPIPRPRPPASPSFARPATAYVPALAPLALAPRARAAGARTLPVRRVAAVQLRRLISALAGGVL